MDVLFSFAYATWGTAVARGMCFSEDRLVETLIGDPRVRAAARGGDAAQPAAEAAEGHGAKPPPPFPRASGVSLYGPTRLRRGRPDRGPSGRGQLPALGRAPAERLPAAGARATRGDHHPSAGRRVRPTGVGLVGDLLRLRRPRRVRRLRRLRPAYPRGLPPHARAGRGVAAVSPAILERDPAHRPRASSSPTESIPGSGARPADARLVPDRCPARGCSTSAASSRGSTSRRSRGPPRALPDASFALVGPLLDRPTSSRAATACPTSTSSLRPLGRRWSPWSRPPTSA